MNSSRLSWSSTALGLACSLAALSASAGTVAISGSRSNITPGGTPGARCAPALTIAFAPAALAASGASSLGSFSYTASHCIAGPPPGPYTGGLFTWSFGDGTLSGAYTGLLSASAVLGQFLVNEDIVFTAGTGRFDGATGSATANGTLRFGQLNGANVSFGEVSFNGQVTAARLPEPASWALVLAGGGLALVASRRRARSVPLRR